jgi:hypothetical protein
MRYHCPATSSGAATGSVSTRARVVRARGWAGFWIVFAAVFVVLPVFRAGEVLFFTAVLLSSFVSFVVFLGI